MGSYSRLIGSSGFLRPNPSSCQSLVIKKNVAVTAVLKGRVYGPEWTPDAESKTSHWKNERILSAVLIPVIPLALIYPNIVTDTALVTTMMLHTHWGFQGFISDYFHGPTLPVVLKGVALVLGSVAFGGLLYFNYADVGFGKAAVMLFKSV